MRQQERHFPRTEALRQRRFSGDIHPYRRLEKRVAEALTPESVLLDAGCGRTAPVLSSFRGRAGRLIGIDLVDFTETVEDCELYCCDLASTGLPNACVDVIYSRSVFEHLDDPTAVLREFHRILEPGGLCIVLTASLWDYATLLAMLVPNKHHATIVWKTEGRAPEDVFPTRYRCNTRSAVTRCATDAGLTLIDFEYMGQYPAYFRFNAALFTLASIYEKAIRRIRPCHPLLGWIMFTLQKPAD